MSAEPENTLLKSEASLADVIKIAIYAVGGQGGGVLTNWIADLATKGGYDVQVTSVAGVAQRTGATIYYVEMAPKSARQPVFAQSPAPGDVDIMIAAELMEAGRSILRGFVTPDRTTLIASTHRILAVSEKQTPGDGRSDSSLVVDEIKKSALKTICFDMEQIAANSGSVISSSLFGALAKSRALPFNVELFIDVIRASGRGVEQSLAAFHGAHKYDETQIDQPETKSKSQSSIEGPKHLLAKWNSLIERLNSSEPSSRSIIEAGLRKVVDYQDLDYGSEYLDRVFGIYELDSATKEYSLTKTAAKYIANAMCYDDILRVADLKIRASRDKRVREELDVSPEAILHVTEYFHPRAEEICATMPASFGAWLKNSPKAFKLLDRLINKGRRIRTDRLGGFLTLWIISKLKPYRRKLLRHKHELNHLQQLQELAQQTVEKDYQLAIEILSCQRLVKGYSDTHARGHSKFSKVMGALKLLKERDDAADWIRRLRELALKDEKGAELDNALKTIASFAGN